MAVSIASVRMVVAMVVAVFVGLRAIVILAHPMLMLVLVLDRSVSVQMGVSERLRHRVNRVLPAERDALPETCSSRSNARRLGGTQ